MNVDFRILWTPNDFHRFLQPRHYSLYRHFSLSTIKIHFKINELFFLRILAVYFFINTF